MDNVSPPLDHRNRQETDRLLPQIEEDHGYFISHRSNQNALKIEIGDNVTVPPTPSPIFSNLADWDHSYFSCSRLLENSSTSSDCMGENSFMEFSDLLDFSNLCGPFEIGENSSSALGLHEQVVEDRTNHEDVEEGSSVVVQGSLNQITLQRPSARPHHLGPLPHNYIEDPADRRAKFIDGLLTVGVKIHNMKVRTGATVRFMAKYENHTFDVKAVDRLIKAKERKNSSRAPLRIRPMDRRSSLVEADGDHDHMYAATILKQNETSGVTDHQYNEVTTTQASGRKDQRPFIQRKSLRDRFARTFITTLFSKVERLTNRTGAIVSLKIKYEGVEITENNWKNVKNLIKARTNPVDACTASTSKISTLSIPSAASPMAFENPDPETAWLDTRNPGAQLRPLSFEGDHDYVILGHDQSHLDNSSREDYYPDSTDTTAYCRPSGRESDHTGTESEAFGQSLLTAKPICQICQLPDSSSMVIASSSQHPNWIRCANPLCLYLVHPKCIGFLVLNTFQLQQLPSYYCPAHRS